MAIIVPILTQFDDKGIKAAIREFERAKTAIDKFGAIGSGFEAIGKSLTKNVTLPLVGVGVALAGIVRGAIDAEAAQARLRKLLLTTGGASNTQIDALIKQAAALEKVGVASKENIVTTMSQLATFDLAGSSISKLTPAILDYVLAEKGASATSDDFKSMTNGLAQALNGQFGSLSRIGFVLDEETKKKIKSGTETERITALVEVLNSTYEGFNQTLLSTPEGQLIKLKNDFKDVKDQIGNALLPVMNEFLTLIRTDFLPIFQAMADRVTNAIQKFSALAPETKRLITYIALFAASFGPLLIAVAKVIQAVQVFIKVFKVLQVALLTNPVYLVAAGLAILVVALIQAWNTSDKFRQGVAKLGNMFIWFAETVINGVIVYLNQWVKGINVILKGLKLLGFNVSEIGTIAPVAFKRISVSSVEAGNSMGALAAQTDTLGATITGQTGPAVDKLGNGIKKTGKEAGLTADQLEQMDKVAKRAAQSVVDRLEDSLRKAESALSDVKGKFDNLKSSISSSITGVINFGDSIKEGDFMQNLTKQAQGATAFADKVKQLIQMGLSESAIRQILSAGFEAGTKIADYIIAGGATVINQVNTLVASVESVADSVGQYGAESFYQAGVDLAQQIVDGIEAELARARAYLQALVDDLPGGSGGVDPNTLKPGKPDKNGRKRNLKTSRLTDKAVKKIGSITDTASRMYTALAQAYGVTKFAKGGIVLGPTNALIGEAGPEAVIPLSGPNSAGLGATYNITVNAGMGTNGAQVGKQIVEAIKKYEKASGQVFAGA